MPRIVALALLMSLTGLIPISVTAGTKSKTFSVPSDVLYEAATSTATRDYRLTSSNADSLSFTFRTGMTAASFGLNIRAVVQSLSGTSSQLTLDIQNADSRQKFSWGAGGRVADKFFEDVQTVLASWRAVDYHVTLVKPALSDTNVFEDDKIRIAFGLTRKWIGFRLANKSDDPLKIDWNQVSYVDVDGNSHRVFHKGIQYKDRESSLPPSVVPPTATFEDIVVPSDYAQWSETGGEFVSRSLLPEAENATTYVGKIFSVFLPIEVHGEVKNYLFSFKISDAIVGQFSGSLQ